MQILLWMKEGNCMFELKLIGIKKYMEATLVLKDITFEAYEGEKIGIVGANGSGKSTILKLIAGIEPMNYYPGYPQTSSNGYDEGLIKMTNAPSCAYLEQTPTYPEGLKVKDILNLAFDEIDMFENQMRDVEEQMKHLEGIELEKILSKYSNLVQLFELKGGYEKDEKLSKVCTGLKFDESFLNRDFHLLSGGEKTTVVLGKLLIHNPTILLLDEPTNHLDMESIEWLEGYLKSYKGIVMIVSHDRYFLDNVVTKIVEVEDMESICYKGNYSSYVSQKEENMRIQFEHFREQQKKINNMEEQVKDLRDWALRADNNKFFRRAGSIQKKLDKMGRITKPVFERRNMRLNLTAAQRSGNETIKVIGLSKSYNDKTIFNDADVLIQYGERVGIIGPNGSGKSSFIKMLLGEEMPDTGIVQLGANVMPAYLPQKIVFNHEDYTVLETFRENISIVEGKAREYLSKFMFYKSSVFKKVKHLSGGERIRLKLAMLLYRDINLLILDEPTNHLDIDSIETLEEALEDFEGTIVFVSHDRYFINKIGQRILAIENQSFESYSGNFDDYRSELDKNNVIPKEEPIVKESKVKQQKAQSNASNKEKKKVKALTKIEELENEISEIELAMVAEHSDYDLLNNLHTKKLELSDELESVMNLWMSLEE